MIQHVQVTVTASEFIHASSDEERQFLIRMKLRSAGIPLGKWGASTVTKGVLEWHDDPDTGDRVIQWRDR